ncbi:FAD-dependent monooxygenase [uncultured Enterovirga sp.]|uniref:FAD-dependent monooxygenase n=1 Tax=uncultured Enterovirga sp. TaxID=2026352 RepID=UPI0035CA8636
MRIAIAGAGIGGLTSALALAGSGHSITVHERRTGFGETGAGIQLSPNATRILLDLGLGPALNRAACEPGRVLVRSLRNGREIGSVALGPAMRERFGAPFLLIARADLHTALLDAVRSRPDIRLRIGRSLVSLENGAETVQLALASESGAQETAEADLVVGADGLWSQMRAGIGDARQPRYGGYAAYRTTLPIEVLPEGSLREEVGLWLGPARHIVHYPIAGGKLLNVVALARRPEPIEGWSRDEEPARLLELFAGRHRDVNRLLGAATRWSAWSLYELPVRELALGRVALVGDAAHPVLPYLAQGGSLAIEDSAHLAARLGQNAANVPAALARYGRERIGRVRKVQSQARRNGFAYHAGGPVAFARDLVMRRLGPFGMTERYAWLYDWRVPPA